MFLKVNHTKMSYVYAPLKNTTKCSYKKNSEKETMQIYEVEKPQFTIVCGEQKKMLRTYSTTSYKHEISYSSHKYIE